jgi:Peptidase family M28
MLRRMPILKLMLTALLFLLLLSPASSNSVTLHFNLSPRDVMESRLKKYGGDNRQREATLKQMFGEAGCGENIVEQPIRGSKVPNVICRLPGGSDKTIIVGAHFDRAAEGDGVVDNWSGASLLPSLYEALKVEPRKHTYLFIGFSEEEKGLVGSKFYVSRMTNEQVAGTLAMVNIDTLGLGPPEVWYSHSDRSLTLDLFHVAVVLDIQVSPLDVEQAGTSDAESFAERHIPRITIHSLTQDTWNAGILHSPKDKISEIRLEDYYNTYHVIAAYLAYLDDVVGQSPSAGSDGNR